MKDNQTQTPDIAERMTHSASQAIQTTQHAADQALDAVDDTVHTLHVQASRSLDKAAQGANAIAQQSAQSVQDATRRLRDGGGDEPPRVAYGEDTPLGRERAARDLAQR